MKKLVFIISTLILPFLAHADLMPTTVPVSFKRVYTPEGFDDNDNVQFVGEGLFANSCYRYEGTTVKVNESDKVIRIASSAFKYDGMCLQVLLPYDHVVDVGLLAKGTYSIVQDQNGQQIGSIVIRSSTTSEPDDNLYAPISQAMYQQKSGANIVTLTGDYPSSCMKLNRVETHVLSNSLIIQPIAEMSAGKCQNGKFPFETEVNLGTVKPGRYLLHVRSMNGKSINNLVDVPTF